jgi:hypothetical protein
MTILVPALAAILSVLVAESVWRLPIIRTSAARTAAYVIGLVFATAVASWLGAASVVSLYKATGGISEARRDHIFEGTMLEVVCATSALAAVRGAAAAGGAAGRARHPVAKAGLTALALILVVVAPAAGVMALLAWLGANNW